MNLRSFKMNFYCVPHVLAYIMQTKNLSFGSVLNIYSTPSNLLGSSFVLTSVLLNTCFEGLYQAGKSVMSPSCVNITKHWSLKATK